ncbi:DsbE family thiol:disulfide interchange protein [Celeribacter sp.]|uniref:DsbE family thiol:disulfide interchange protein n=1 Tax=Celeribacter sp. TaxID=1890673 RepID=UPI003A8D3DA8
MARINPLMALPPLLFAGLAGLFAFGMSRDDADDLPSTFIGREAPKIEANSLMGLPTFTNETLKDGQIKIVNFWASWCPPCRAEHPTLMKFSKQGIPVYGVTIRDEERQSAEFLKTHGNPFKAVVADTGVSQSINWGVTAPPETFIIDGNGKVLFKFIGPLIGDDLEQRFMPELRSAMGE